MTIWTTTFWLAALERAVKTFGQVFGASLAVTAASPLATDWVGILQVAGVAALLSLLTSIGSDAATKSGPSLTNVETLDEPRHRA